MSSFNRGRAGDYIRVSIQLKCLKSEKIENEKAKLKETISAIHAMLNSGGGEVKLNLTTQQNTSQLLINVPQTKIKHSFTRKIEQCLTKTAGSIIISDDIKVKYYINSIIVTVKKADTIIINRYNLYLPTQTQAVLINPLQPTQRVINSIVRRKGVQNRTKFGCHCKQFVKGQKSHLSEGQNVQFKNVKSSSSKHTTLADRMVCKGNKFCHYVSAFANYDGGNIYYGITDDSLVEGEYIVDESCKYDITKKVEMSIKKMIWPQKLGQPKQGEQWDIFFEPAEDENFEVIPSMYVIVIYIAPCLGGVYTEEPECYEVVEGEVRNTWKTVLKWDDDYHGDEIPTTIQRTTWSSSKTEKLCTHIDEFLMNAINNANWSEFSERAQFFESKYLYSDRVEVQLIVISKHVVTWCRKNCPSKAKKFLAMYYEVLKGNVTDITIFEAIALYLEIALQRAEGKHMSVVSEVLSVVEGIPCGVISASLLILAATTTSIEDDQNSRPSNILCEKALEHLKNVKTPNKVKTDLQRKAHINLAQQRLGVSFSTNTFSKDLTDDELHRANSNITSIKQSISKEDPLACYREIQFNTILSIQKYRHFQASKNQSEVLLRESLDKCREAKKKAENCQFQEMMEWTKMCEGLVVQELVLVHYRKTTVQTHIKHSQKYATCASSNETFWCQQI